MNNMNNYNFDHTGDQKKGVTSPLTSKNVNNYIPNKSDINYDNNMKNKQSNSQHQKFDMKRNTNAQQKSNPQYFSER